MTTTGITTRNLDAVEYNGDVQTSSGKPQVARGLWTNHRVHGQGQTNQTKVVLMDDSNFPRPWVVVLMAIVDALFTLGLMFV